ncbi:hypothetical protein pb186bvf_017421 [Paramecium bursaria]
MILQCHEKVLCVIFFQSSLLRSRSIAGPTQNLHLIKYLLNFKVNVKQLCAKHQSQNKFNFNSLTKDQQNGGISRGKERIIHSRGERIVLRRTCTEFQGQQQTVGLFRDEQNDQKLIGYEQPIKLMTKNIGVQIMKLRESNFLKYIIPDPLYEDQKNFNLEIFKQNVLMYLYFQINLMI